MSPEVARCPCGATGWGQSHWLDTHTGRYEAACACCQDEGEITFAEFLDRFEFGAVVPAGFPAEWLDERARIHAAQDAADAASDIQLPHAAE